MIESARATPTGIESVPQQVVRWTLCRLVTLFVVLAMASVSSAQIYEYTQPTGLGESCVIVKVRPGFLPPVTGRKATQADPATQVQEWSASLGSLMAKPLWKASPSSSLALARDDHPGARTFVLTPAAGVNPDELVDQLLRLPWVEYAERDRLVQLHAVPNDPLYTRQWHLENTGQAYWAVVGVSGSGNDTIANLNGLPGADVRFLTAYNHPGPKGRVPVCIIDTGLDTDHEDLQGALFVNDGEIPDNGIDDDHNGFIDDVYGWDFSGNTAGTPNVIVPDNDVRDSIGHGTHVGGTVAAVVNNGIGIAGVCDSARIFSGKIFPNAYFSVSAQAIYYAVMRGAMVINMSWGGAYPSSAIRDALSYAAERGVVLVASMGNSGLDQVFYPSGYPETIGVGASTATDRLGTFSTYNDFVEIIAPGRDVLSLRAFGTDMYAPGGEPEVHIIGETYYIASGTSMAAPHVSGAAAVLLSLAPGLSADRVREILTGTADDVVDPYGDGANLPGFDRFTGWGRINLERAIAELPGVFATITSPAHFTWVGGNVDISGYATGGAFAGYSLLAAPGHGPDAADFAEFASGVAPVTGGVLGTWNTAPLSGPYTLRINAGADAVFDLPVFVIQDATASIVSPTAGDFVQLAATVIGTAAGAGFQSYTLDAVGPIPTTTARPIGTYSSPAWEDTLGVWSLESLPVGDYWLRLRLTTDAGIELDSARVTVASVFHAGWPVTLGANAHFAVTAVDIDADGIQEIVCPSNKGLRVLRANGTPYPGWPRDTLVNYRTPAAFADLDDDGKYEIIIATPDAMHVYTWIGEEYPDWPKPFNAGSHLYGTSLPTVGDIDADGHLEIAAIQEGGAIRVWRENGAVYTPSQTGSFGNLAVTNSSGNA
ncbi:MAG: S8 family serine peptidase, partial [Candidatus Zixiibacteriota bacterium]